VCETSFLAYLNVFVTDISFFSGSYLNLSIFILTCTYLCMASESSKKRTIYDECKTFQFREGKLCEQEVNFWDNSRFLRICQFDSLVKANCVVVGIISKTPKLFRKVNLLKKILNLLLT